MELSTLVGLGSIPIVRALVKELPGTTRIAPFVAVIVAVVIQVALVLAGASALTLTAAAATGVLAGALASVYHDVQGKLSR